MRFFEEIAEREDRNLYQIVLYPEGLFYKAYERSAFACVSRVAPFQPSKKRIKYCGREMVSVGFPMSVLPKYFPSAPRPLPDGRVVVALTDRIDPVACEDWKASLPLKQRQPRGGAARRDYVSLPPVDERPASPFMRTETSAAPAGADPSSDGRPSSPFMRPVDPRPEAPAPVPAPAASPRAERVIRLIREFRLEAATPVECVLFVADLKKELDGYL
ncbi:MAG: hypothetical protein K2J53_06865 [Alistipes sp.]|nr:hypothetical protein [Alistipes sp.]